MPYVLKLEADAVDRMFNTLGTTTPRYFCGNMMPESGMGAPARSTTRFNQRPAEFSQVADINLASRIPLGFKAIAERKLTELAQNNIVAKIQYDLPRPVKMLKWLFTAPTAK